MHILRPYIRHFQNQNRYFQLLFVEADHMTSVEKINSNI